MEALAAHNGLTGGLTETLNGLIRLARGLGAVGVTSELNAVHPRTRARTTFILPLELVDPAVIKDITPDTPEHLQGVRDELIASAESRMGEQGGGVDETAAMQLAIARSPQALQLYVDTPTDWAAT